MNSGHHRPRIRSRRTPFSGRALALFVLLGAAAPHGRAQEADTGSAERGRRVFEAMGCFMCHGNEGSGGVRNRNSATGERVPTLTYTSRGFTNQALRERVLKGSGAIRKLDPSGITPPLSMPPFRGRLSDEELGDLVSYVRSLTPGEGEEPKPASPLRPPVPEAMLAGDSCQICHGAAAERFGTNLHNIARRVQRGDTLRTVCVVCHGDGSEHARQYGDPAALVQFTKDSPTPRREKDVACLSCHERDRMAMWTGSAHESRSVACVDCHTIMEPASDRSLLSRGAEQEVCAGCHAGVAAKTLRSSHMPLREGGISCSGCHNAHGTPNDGGLIGATVNETCFRCHAEKRGPFLWEHPPVSENCLNCHDPHGSSHRSLTTIDPPRLCQQCHAGGDVHVTTPQAAASRYVANRSCLNCHSQIHGSNSPSGFQLLR